MIMRILVVRKNRQENVEKNVYKQLKANQVQAVQHVVKRQYVTGLYNMKLETVYSSVYPKKQKCFYNSLIIPIRNK